MVSAQKAMRTAFAGSRSIGLHRWPMYLCGALLALAPLHGQVKLAQTGFQFLSVPSDARASALGGAMTTVDWGSGAMYFNPAGMARLETRFDVTFSDNKWIADINHNSFSFALKLGRGSAGVIGLSLHSVDYGEQQGTMVWPNRQGYIDTEIFSPTAFAAGVGYANAISTQFSVGAHVKYTGQSLGKSVIPAGEDGLKNKRNVALGLAYDFGTIFKTGYRSVIFGMSVRNFSSEFIFEEESFQLPLVFNLGLSVDLLEFFFSAGGSQSLLLMADASHPRAFSEQFSIATEYSIFSGLFLRGAYQQNYDERDISFGAGLHLLGLSVDYAYTPFNRFTDIQRFTVRLGY